VLLTGALCQPLFTFGQYTSSVSLTWYVDEGWWVLSIWLVRSLVRGMTVLANWWSLPMEGRPLTGASRRDSVSSDVHTFSTYKSYMHRVA
jgi:hypothetical protein